jgi:hypothetical protein
MSYAKQSVKRKRRRTAAPVLGAAGLSLSLASGASGAPAANIAAQHADVSQEFILPKRKSLTSAWRLSTFSTKKTPDHFERACCLPGEVVVVVAEAAVVEAAVAVAALGDVQAAAVAVLALEAVAVLALEAVAVLALEDAEDVEAAVALEAAPVALAA